MRKNNNTRGAQYSTVIDNDIVNFYNSLFKHNWKFLNTAGTSYIGRNLQNPLVILQKMPIKKGIPRRRNNYSLSHCNITLSNGPVSHAICGFVNKGEYYVYDSNFSSAFKYDWSSQKAYRDLAKYFSTVYLSGAQDPILVKFIACYIRDRGKVNLNTILNNPLLLPLNYVKSKNVSQTRLRQTNARLFQTKNKNALSPVSPNARNNRNNREP